MERISGLNELERVCDKCGVKYKVPITAANLMFFCPECHSSNGSISDYGFGPITPCDVYSGDHKIGEITGGADDYHLTSRELGINVTLTRPYKDLAVYHEAESMILLRLSGERPGETAGETPENETSKKRLFQYDPGATFDMKEGTLLDAFSVDGSGRLYYWNKSSELLISTGAALDRDAGEKRSFRVPVYSASGVSNGRRLASLIFSSLARKRKMKECASYVDGNRFIEKIMEHDKEDAAAARVISVTSIKEKRDRIIVRCKRQYKNKPAFVLDAHILKNISGFEDLKKILTELMNETKDSSK